MSDEIRLFSEKDNNAAIKPLKVNKFSHFLILLSKPEDNETQIISFQTGLVDAIHFSNSTFPQTAQTTQTDATWSNWVVG